MNQPVLLITPTYPEYSAVRAVMADRLVDGSLQLAMCGVGPARATALCRQLEQSDWAGSMVLLGWAGGLAADLAAGDRVLADAAVDVGGQRVPLLFPDLPGARVGPLLCVPAPLLTRQAKRDARKCGALAVEMEAYPLAEWSARRGVPFVHARVILDTAHETLPDLGDALDALGRVRPVRLAQRLLARPREALSLLSLARRVREFDHVLGSFARTVVELWRE